MNYTKVITMQDRQRGYTALLFGCVVSSSAAEVLESGGQRREFWLEAGSYFGQWSHPVRRQGVVVFARTMLHAQEQDSLSTLHGVQPGAHLLALIRGPKAVRVTRAWLHKQSAAQLQEPGYLEHALPWLVLGEEPCARWP